eukprot:3191174-Amphidinium_carterae.1
MALQGFACRRHANAKTSHGTTPVIGMWLTLGTCCSTQVTRKRLLLLNSSRVCTWRLKKDDTSRAPKAPKAPWCSLCGFERKELCWTCLQVNKTEACPMGVKASVDSH